MAQPPLLLLLLAASFSSSLSPDSPPAANASPLVVGIGDDESGAAPDVDQNAVWNMFRDLARHNSKSIRKAYWSSVDRRAAEADNESTIAVRVRCSGAWGHLSKRVARPQRCW